MFADDTNLFIKHQSINGLIKKANKALSSVHSWFESNKLTLHPQKSNYIIFKSKKAEISDDKIKLGNIRLERVGEKKNNKFVKFVGIAIDENLTWKHQLLKITKAINTQLFYISKHRFLLSDDCKILLYNALIKTHLDYGNIIWGFKLQDQILKLQKKAVRNIMGSRRLAHTNSLFIKMKALKFQDLLSISANHFTMKTLTGQNPACLSNIVTYRQYGAPTRESLNPKLTTDYSYNSLQANLSISWNNLDDASKLIPTTTFKRTTKEQTLMSYTAIDVLGTDLFLSLFLPQQTSNHLMGLPAST